MPSNFLLPFIGRLSSTVATSLRPVHSHRLPPCYASNTYSNNAFSAWASNPTDLRSIKFNRFRATRNKYIRRYIKIVGHFRRSMIYLQTWIKKRNLKNLFSNLNFSYLSAVWLFSAYICLTHLHRNSRIISTLMITCLSVSLDFFSLKNEIIIYIFPWTSMLSFY